LLISALEGMLEELVEDFVVLEDPLEPVEELVALED
jgi:hypothetical protein